MKSICTFWAFFVFCLTVSLEGNASKRESKIQKNLRKLGLSNNELALNMHKRLVMGPNKNVLFSPLSISTVFGMLFYGTRGNATEELREALGYDQGEIKSSRVHETFRIYLTEVFKYSECTDSFTMSTANAILADKRLELFDEYKRRVQDYYRVPIREVDFQNEAIKIVQEVNEFVREQTNGKIDKLIDVLSPSTLLVLLNAAYFKGTWKTRFDPEQTKEEIFYNYGRESEGRRVPLMHVTSHFPYTHVDEYQAIELPFKGGKVSMVIFLPNERDELEDLEDNLSPKKFAGVLRRMHSTKVDLWLPKFSIEFEKELTEDMYALDASDIFHSGADLAGMTKSKNVSVSQVLHKAVIEVDEEGSEPSTVSSIGGVFRSAFSFTPKFRADHPFMYTIVEKGSNTNMILFAGRVNNF